MNRRPTPNLVFLICAVLAIAAAFLVPAARVLRFPLTLLGIPVIALGVWLSVRANRELARAQTTTEPFEWPKALVTAGPYAFCRNPVYLSAAIQLLGLGVLLGNALGLLVVLGWIVLLDIFYVRPEEQVMEEQFGEAYAVYRQQTRRWL